MGAENYNNFSDINYFFLLVQWKKYLVFTNGNVVKELYSEEFLQ